MQVRLIFPKGQMAPEQAQGCYLRLQLLQQNTPRRWESVIPESNNKFVWNIRTVADKVTPFNAEVSGRKNKAIVKVDEFSEEGETPSLHKKSRIFRKLHRLHSDKQNRLGNRVVI